jgi:NADPH2:quinone reductase
VLYQVRSFFPLTCRSDGTDPRALESREAFEVKKDQFIAVQAAAGGLGLLLCQLCANAGAHVIGTTSTSEKAAIALAAGASDVILYDGSVNVVDEVYKITGGEGLDRGVNAVFDGVGKDTWETAFEIVKRKGTIVTCGNASGTTPAFQALKLGYVFILCSAQTVASNFIFK